MAEDYQQSEDEFLESIIKSRDSGAVLKVSFATFASSVPEQVKIFALEGQNDKTVYYHWISRLRADLEYDTYICKNKLNLLRLFDLLSRDLTGLFNRVYFFTDKDFDGLQGRDASAKIFVTCKYSIENYIVTSQVLEDLLKVDFHCNGYFQLRADIISNFLTIYSQFLDHTKSINFRIFMARKLNIRQTEDLPASINSLADVKLENVLSVDIPANETVKLEREPTEDEKIGLLSEFNHLNSLNDYRGKFALLFFIKWLSLLREDRCSDNPIYFNGIPKAEAKIRGDFSLTTLASKSAPPNHLYNFLVNIE